MSALFDGTSTATPTTPLSLGAALVYLGGDAVAAAEWYRRIGSRTDEAEARLQAARGLHADGHADRAAAQLRRVVAFARRVGATRWLEEADRLDPSSRA